MGICPTLSHAIKHELYGINPHLAAKWDRRLERWEVWFDDKIREPYIIAITKNHLDKRILDEVRGAVWFSQHIKQNAIEMQNEAEYAKIRQDKRHDDEYTEMGKELAPLMNTIVDAGTSSHGKSKTMFQGIGSRQDI
jgi:hypothetical protein